MTVRLLVAYDGADFAGFQVQPGPRTVQRVLEYALSGLAREPVRVRAAGRTDAGVHALGQVVSFESDLHPEVILRAAPSVLPSDVSIVDAASGPEEFDARRSARSRSYTYLIWTAEPPHPLYRRYAFAPRRAIDPFRVDRALRVLVGEHDFTSFARVREDQSPMRTVLEASCVADTPFVRITITAESFLHQMVRSIVGTALEIGGGRRDVDWMGEVLEARDRAVAGPVAPAHGLTLTAVDYDAPPWPRGTAVTWPWSDHVRADDERQGRLA